MIAFTARAHADGIRLSLLVSHDEYVGHLLHGEVADLGVHLFVAAVQLDAQSGILSLLLYFFRVVEMALADGDESDLQGREPEREGARVVLDEDAEETLD